MKCQVGCDTREILDTLGLQWGDLYPPREAEGPVATYDYTTDDGQLLFQVVRFAGKQFRQRRPDGRGGWAWNLQGVPRVLYRLPSVLKAVGADEPVLVVEGEKDVHSLEARGFTATCNPGGAGKWRDYYSEVLRGADVIVVQDQDDAGRAHAAAVVASLSGLARRVRLVEPVEGKDVTDHLNAGHTVEQLHLIEPAPSTNGLTATDSFPKDSPVRLKGSAVFDLEVPEISTLPVLGQQGLVLEGGSNLLYAYPKTGKTEFIRHVLEEWISEGRRVAYVSEEPLWFWKPRLRLYDHPAEFWDGVEFVSAMAASVDWVLKQLPPAYDVLIVDTLRNTCGYQESKGDEDVARVIHPLIVRSRSQGATLVALYHARKMPGEGGQDISGHHSLYGAFDRAISLRRIEGQENERKRRLYVSGRLLSPDAPSGLTYEMQSNGMFRAQDVRSIVAQQLCGWCGKNFQPLRKTARFCSENCRQKSFQAKGSKGD